LHGKRTGIGVFAAEIVAHWPDEPLVQHVRAGQPGDREHGRLWHLRTAWEVRRSGERYLSPDSLIVPTLLGRRATVAVHDLATLEQPENHHLRARLFYRALLGLACRRVGAVIVPTAATRDALVARHPGVASRVHLAPYAPRRIEVQGELPAQVRRPFVLHTGTHEPRKNVIALVEGFLSAPVPEPWQLVLAGKPGWLSPEDSARLDGLVERSGGRVLRLGFVDDATLAALYDEADVFAYPSSYEGFGLPVLEAMLCATAVVTTDAAAVAEVSGGAARTVPLGPGLPERLGAALAELAADPAAREELVAKGLRRAAEFDWARTAAQVHAAVAGTGT
jgi:glycosyltransferase involved in cell wall biosynthesis